MATAEERKEFDRHVGGKQTHPVPKPPEFPKEIFDKPVPERKAAVERFNKELDDWRKKIDFRIEPEAPTVPATATTTTTAVKGAKGDKGEKGGKGDTGSVGSPGPVGPAGAGSIVQIVGGGTVAGYQAVTASGVAADSATVGHLQRVIGIALEPMSAGVNGRVQVAGEVSNAAWAWTPNTPVFLNGAALSHTAPTTGFVQRIGVARTATALVVQLGEPILL